MRVLSVSYTKGQLVDQEVFEQTVDEIRNLFEANWWQYGYNHKNGYRIKILKDISINIIVGD